MTKKVLISVVIFLSVAAMPRDCSGDDAVKKFSRGLCNVLTCYMEIQEQSVRTKEAHGSLAGMTYGLLKGIFMTGVRGAVGLYEMATFPFPLPGEYRPILTEPENFFDKAQ